MIRLDIEKYCHECLDFTPDVIKPEREVTEDIKGKRHISYTDTIVQCKYRKRCAGIKRFLEQKIKEGTNNEFV